MYTANVISNLPFPFLTGEFAICSHNLPYNVHIKAIRFLLLHSDLWRKKLKLPPINFLTFKVIFGLPPYATLQKNYFCKKNCLHSHNCSETHSLKRIPHSKLLMKIYQMKDSEKVQLPCHNSVFIYNDKAILKNKKVKKISSIRVFWGLFQHFSNRVNRSRKQESTG